jgi:hypothetical protein
MHDTLAFYPRPGLARMHRWFAGGTGVLAAALAYGLADALVRFDPGAWGFYAAMALLTLVCTMTAVIGWRRAQRIADARANAEPQLVVDPFGVLVRDDFLWRAHRFAWSKIRAVDAVPDDHGVSIVVEGQLRPLGRLVDIPTDSTEPAEAIALRLQQLVRRPTLH